MLWRLWQVKAEKAEARNALEGYLYDVRNKLLEHEEEVALVRDQPDDPLLATVGRAVLLRTRTCSGWFSVFWVSEGRGVCIPSCLPILTCPAGVGVSVSCRVSQVSTDEQRTAVLTLVDAVDEWMYD